MAVVVTSAQAASVVMSTKASVGGRQPRGAAMIAVTIPTRRHRAKVAISDARIVGLDEVWNRKGRAGYDPPHACSPAPCLAPPVDRDRGGVRGVPPRGAGGGSGRVRLAHGLLH